MDVTHQIIKIGLYGIPGAGKSTTSRIIENHCAENKYSFARIKLADPLYEAQEAIYAIAGRKLNNFCEQDGELLNFLGYYLRKINQNILLDRFSTRIAHIIEEIDLSDAPFGVIVCDDVRRPDADFIRSNNFLLVRVVAHEELCLHRRNERRDRSLGAVNHLTEQGLDEIISNYQIENNTTLQDLRAKVVRFIEEIGDDFNRQRNIP